MALRALFPLLCLCSLFLHCFPLPLDTLVSDGLDTTTELVIVTAVVTSSVEVLETSTVLLVPVETSSSQAAPSPPPSPPAPSATTPIAPPPPTSSSALASTPLAPSPPSPPSPSTIINYITITDTLTPPPVTVTIEDPSVTTTEVITTTPTSPEPTSSAFNQTVWSVPPQITDLSCFKVSEFAYGQNNMKVVQGIPTEASATTAATLAVASTVPNATNEPPPTAPTWDNSSSALQLFYPAGSVNPTTEPQGGADFYAAPIDIRNTQNISLEYSVFFPADFDWVLAGKLPGIYGGHKTCSGGDDALSCFSTRLMWREGGAGELYLYAPKDRQTEALCSTPPMSVCDQTYGLSIGRGSFNFTPGAWTHVTQTVWLNTPGQQDGGFVLQVDGREVIHREDVFYRDVASTTPPPADSDPGDDESGDPDYSDNPDGDDSNDDSGDSGGDDSGDDSGGADTGNGDTDSSGNSADTPPSSTPSSGPDTSAPDPPPTPAPPPPPAQPQQPAQATPAQDPGLGSLLGPLGPLLSGVGASLPLRRQEGTPAEVGYLPYGSASPPSSSGPAITGSAATPTEIANPQTGTATATMTAQASTQTVWSQTTTTTTAYVAQVTFASDQVQVLSQDPGPIAFSGLFFSSFFGGHEEEYKTPRDQYTWFKDFAMTINA